MAPRHSTQLTEGSYTPEERDDILIQVRHVVESHFFRNSKRYPDFLLYIVTESLAGKAEELKERTLGIEIFERSPTYDTSGDSIVRVAAAEVRKRLTQYYREEASASEIIIELPPGSYVPSFRNPHLESPSPSEELSFPAESVAADFDRREQPLVAIHQAASPTVKRTRTVAYALVACAIAAICVSALLLKQKSANDTPYFDSFIGTGPGRVLVCVGAPSLRENQPSVNATDSESSLGQPAENNVLIPFSDTRAISIVTTLLDSVSRPRRVDLARNSTFSELQLGPAVLIGALDNPWTRRVSNETPFIFVGNDSSAAKLVYRNHPAQVLGSVDFSVPYSNRTQDFAVLSLFNSETLHQPTVIIAGIGPNGTMAAAELLADSVRLRQVFKEHPRHGKGPNVSIVLATQVIQGQSGFPRVVDVQYW